MPKYFYRCEECEHELETYHSIKTVLEDCPDCLSSSLVRVPQLIFLKKEVGSTKKVGAVVTKHIEEARRELKKEKKSLANEEYEK
tara:strand:- start:360 stop:614 length:255 start_codon:yes stop_codon:yes gene_type:complete